MDIRNQLHRATSFEQEFSIFSSALSLLSELDSTNQNAAQEKLAALYCDATNLDKEQATKHIIQFINKFKRKLSRSFASEAFDLRTISTSLKNETQQRLYLQRDPKFQYCSSRQLLNITTKVINHFDLNNLANLFKSNYFDQVDLVSVNKYLDPEHKPSKTDDPVTRYASLLTTMSNKLVTSEHVISCPNPDLFATESGFRLVPKNKMNPRLPLLKKMGERTPEGIKYDIGREEYLIDVGEIVGTEELLKLKHNKHASKTPGPIFLSSFPIVNSPNPETQTVADLINDFNISSVVTIEEKFIAEQVFENEVKALPSDWVQNGVNVGLVQCPDLHALRLSHNFLVAQYLFSEVLKLLPPVKEDHANYMGAINNLMKRSFRDTDKDPNIKSNAFPNLFHDVADTFSGIKDNKYYINFLMKSQEKIWKKSEEQPSVQNHQEHALIHCKAGMSRSATALISMYIISIDIILNWHAKDFIQNKNDQTFFGAIIKAIFNPDSNPLHDIHVITQIFSDNYRPIKLIPDQINCLAQLIHYKRNMLKEANILNNHVIDEVVGSVAKKSLPVSLTQIARK